MTIPKVPVRGFFPKQRLPFKGVVIRTMEPREKIVVRDFMLKNFYTSAPVPAAIRLGETWPSYKYLEDELGIMLYACFIVLVALVHL